MLLPAAGVYYLRTHVDVDEFIMEQGMGLLFIMPTLLCGLMLVVLFVAPLIWASIHIVLGEARKLGYPLPFVALIVSLLVSISIPLPSSAVGREFAAHRPEYEAVVKLAEQHQLHKNPRCLYGLELPSTYQRLSRVCVQAIDQPALAMAFDPPTTRRLIIYARSPEALAALRDCCFSRGNVYEKVDEHWYFFTPAGS